MDFATLTFDMCRCYVNDQREIVGDEITNRVLGWIRSRDVKRLSSCPEQIGETLHTLHLCRYTRQVAAFFKKNKAFCESSVCEKAAEDAFFKAESSCRITNRKLDWYFAHYDRLDDRLKLRIERVQRIVESILGDFDAFLEEIPSLMRVTAGATSTRSRKNSLPYLKVGLRGIPATRRAQPYLKAFASSKGYDKVQFKTVFSNRVETVPKNWKTDRTIACEPEGNLCLQLAFDSFAKVRLRKLGVDLSDQSENQRLAQIGSMDGSFATLDLSMASDTVAFNTVAWLFPVKWFNYLNSARTPLGVGFGKRFKYAKFSSMGNGSTFAIETMIFAAIAAAVSQGDEFAVYGDDIIVKTEHVEGVLELLQFFGFRVNTEKSYTSGPFRESCGADWYSGYNVTPVYVRCSNPREIELTHICNTLASVCSPDGTLAEYLRGIIHEEQLPFVPFNESTISGVWVTAHDAYKSKVIRNHDQRLEFKAFVPATRSRLVADSRTLFLWHLDAQRREARENTTFRLHPFLHDALEAYDREASLVSSIIIRSKVPVFTNKYRRKWVSWFVPAMVTPIHLHWWSDYLIRYEADLVG